MQLKYVGDMPVVSKNGVTFDHAQPDRYVYLSAAVELLEALSYGATETTQHLYQTQAKELSGADIEVLLKKYINNMDELIKQRDKKALDFVEELIERVQTNDTLNEDERAAWLGNIKMMKDYFVQYVTNKTAYEAALEALGDEVHVGKIKEITVPMFKNYGIVLHDLMTVLENRKAPIDSDVRIEEKDEKLIGTLSITHR